MSDENKIRDAADAVSGIVKAAPIYQDLIQPAAQELGKGLQTVVKTVHVALAPVSMLVWGYDQIKDFVSTKVAERLKTIPSEDIVTPKLNVAGPALEALRYVGHEESLSDLYANLLASSMNKNIAKGAHPAFVDMIKQLTSDEAKLLRFFAKDNAFPLISVSLANKAGGGSTNWIVNYSHFGIDAECEFPEMTSSYIDNLCRLGLIEVPIYGHYKEEKIYDRLLDDAKVKSAISLFAPGSERVARIDKKHLRVTELGKQFSKICISI